MRLVDLSHSSDEKEILVKVKSGEPIDSISLDRLITLATVLDLTDRSVSAEVSRRDLASKGISGISGCILRTGWADDRLAGYPESPPVLGVDAAAYLLEGGVRTVAADFPITGAAADLLLTNGCILVYCISNTAELSKDIVRLVALPPKTDAHTAPARVIAIEE